MELCLLPKDPWRGRHEYNNTYTTNINRTCTLTKMNLCTTLSAATTTTKQQRQLHTSNLKLVTTWREIMPVA